jgi:hypothetical protein
LATAVAGYDRIGSGELKVKEFDVALLTIVMLFLIWQLS